MQKIFNDRQENYVLKNKDLEVEFLPTGDIFQFNAKEIMLNRNLSNALDGSLNNIYLRVFKEDEIKAYPLLGIKSNSDFYVGENSVKWQGQVAGINYTVSFSLSNENVWFWDVDLSGDAEKIDLIYTQDIGLAAASALQNNEAYVAQYLDQKVFSDENHGYSVCIRQNQAQSGQHPYIQEGSFNKNVSFSTDGMQFFGEEYKYTNFPEALKKECLANEVKQYEFTFTALASEQFYLDKTAKFTFYGLYNEDHPEVIKAPKPIATIEKIYNELDINTEYKKVRRLSLNDDIGEPLKVEPLSTEELNQLYAQRKAEEILDGQLLSFFTAKNEHVVLPSKELLMERPHGQILFSGNSIIANSRTLSSTNWIYGIFNSHTVIGNTDQNKLLSNKRDDLNLFKTTGQRIYVKLDNQYKLLALPSVYEIGINHCKWIYKTKEDTFIVEVTMAADSTELLLDFYSQSGKAYEYLITNQVIMSPNEYEHEVKFEKHDDYVSVYSSSETLNAKYNPELRYDIAINNTDFEIVDENVFVEGVKPGSASLLVFKLDASSNFKVNLQAYLKKEEHSRTNINPQEERAKFYDKFKHLTKNFQLNLDGKKDIEKINIIIWWYTHNMLVHYLVPHGLEQYSGAAWGTRDVLQGPADYFIAVQEFPVLKDILLKVYKNQYIEDGNWPQWFMFDDYFFLRDNNSHGDIIIWPLKALADYISQSDDISILDEEVAYTSRNKKEYTSKKYKLIDHIHKQLAYINNHFVNNTYLSKYGNGDWNDSLQPANERYREYLVSPWTVALTYEALTKFADAISPQYEEASAEIENLAANIKESYQKIIMQNKVIPGLLLYKSKNQMRYLIHPSEDRTSVDYRMLPMIEGITSEILSKDQARLHFDIIQSKLKFEDGVHLFDKPIEYHGGETFIFNRAETAAFWGREIGQNYTHANIRYIEAMALLGESEAAFDELMRINPINIQDLVKNADLRQSNVYSSSSDASFLTRYEAQEEFSKLKEGKIDFKGGWRIYSSGPGLYVARVINDLLGIRFKKSKLLIDPVLSAQFDGLEFNFQIYSKPVIFKYHKVATKKDYILINGNKIKGRSFFNPYRESGLEFNKDKVLDMLNNDDNIIDVYF